LQVNGRNPRIVTNGTARSAEVERVIVLRDR
jgi:hypothetical protein